MNTNDLNQSQERALDQLLSLATPPPASPLLADQILAATKPSTQSAEIVNLAAKRNARKKALFTTDKWLVGGIMAASLVIGIWSGTNDIANLLVTAPLELAGIEQTGDFEIYNILDGFSATESLL